MSAAVIIIITPPPPQSQDNATIDTQMVNMDPTTLSTQERADIVQAVSDALEPEGSK